MKKIIIPALIVIAIAVVAIFYFCHENKGKAQPIDADVAFFFDGKQLIDKSGILEQLNESQRKTLGTMLASELDMIEHTEYIQTLVENPNNTGIDFTQPIYTYINFFEETEHVEIVGVAAIENVENVDKFVEFYLDNVDNADTFSVESVGDNHLVISAFNNIFWGYNEEILAVVNTGDNVQYNRELLMKALEIPYADLTIFGERDVAMYVDYNRFADMMEYIYKAEDLDQDIAALFTPERIAEMRAALGENASMIAGLTFENGRAVIDGVVNDVNTDNYIYTHEILNENLKYINEELLAIINFNIDGGKVAEMLRTLPAEYIASELYIDTNEFMTGMQLVCDIISSIDGDVTIALDKLEGESLHKAPKMEAIAMVDVKDDYIISNVAMFGSQFLTPIEPNCYTFTLNRDFHFNVGQKENVFYGAVNKELVASDNPATTTRWIADLKSFHSYLLIDAENIEHNLYINKLLEQSFRYDSEKLYAVQQLIGMSDYLYCGASSATSFEFAWVMDNKQTNALKTIVDTFVSDITAIIAEM